MLTQEGTCLLDIIDARAHIETLAATIAFAQQRFRTSTSSNGEIKVRTASRSTGGVAMIESSRTPVKASWSVRGIGVADNVRTWTSARSSLSRSLCLTPKCCSSSTMTSPDP